MFISILYDLLYINLLDRGFLFSRLAEQLNVIYLSLSLSVTFAMEPCSEMQVEMN